MPIIEREYNLAQMLQEIDCCWRNHCYVAALSMTLVLPDICAKIQYPDKQDGKKQMKPGEKYISWCNRWLKSFFPSDRSSLVISEKGYGSRGEHIYKLRCGILHNGEFGVDRDVKLGDNDLWFRVENFRILINESSEECASAYLHSSVHTGKTRNKNNPDIEQISLELGYLISAIRSAVICFLDNRKIKPENYSLMNFQIRSDDSAES